MPLELTHPTDDQLRGFLHGSLPHDTANDLDAHIATCRECARRLERAPSSGGLAGILRGLPLATPSQLGKAPPTNTMADGSTRDDALTGDDLADTRADFGDTPMPDEPSKILTGVFDSRPNLARDPDSTPFPATPAATSRLDAYELLGELGEGGMGVVYKARQIALDRLVALKMVIAGGRASSRQLARFHTEALAVARLDHPNIVRIYDTGDENGVPFFAMEYVEGGTLERKLRKLPMDPRLAAPLLETIARAIHYAHERGIVHRDLKPANILLTPAGEPKVTDFGLAKQLDTDGGQTHTGAVMGTPNYMPPEQADGRTKDVTAAADVYALGATLYDMITGRPPFQGPTVVSIIEQVKTLEPITPSRLQPGVPRDLETICLKCLRKEPEKRYTSAADLADDLRRFVEGRPILARPVGAAERAVRWCKRNPRVAVISALAVAAFLAFLATIGASYWKITRTNSELKRSEEATSTANVALTRANTELNASERAAVSARNAAERQNKLNSEQTRYLARSLAAELRAAGMRRPLERLVQYLAANMNRLEKLSTEASEVADRGAFATELQQAQLYEEIGHADIDRAAEMRPLAEKHYRSAAKLADEVLREHPDSDLARANKAMVNNALAAFLKRQVLTDPAKIEEAARIHVEALKLRREIVESPLSGPDSRDYIFPANALSSLAESHEHMAEVAELRRDVAAAAEHVKQSRELHEKALAMVQADPKSTDDPLGIEPFQQSVARAYLRASAHVAARTPKDAADAARLRGEAEKFLNKALELQARTVDANADSIPNKKELASVLFSIGKNRLIAGKHAEARDAFDRMYLLMNEVRKQGNEASNRDSRKLMALALYGVGVMNLKLGERGKADVAFQEAVELRRRLAEEEDRPANFWTWMVVLARAGDHAKAIEVLKKEQARQGEQLRKPFVESFWFNAAATYSLAAEAVGKWAPDANLDADQRQQRESYLASALDAVRELFKVQSKRTSELDNDPDLEFLRKRPAFQALLKELRGKN